MNYPYFSTFQQLSPAAISIAIPLFSEIEASGVNDEFAVVAATYRRTDDPLLRQELERLFCAEIRRPGVVFSL
jgi:hypothetical protein